MGTIHQLLPQLPKLPAAHRGLLKVVAHYGELDTDEVCAAVERYYQELAAAHGSKATLSTETGLVSYPTEADKTFTCPDGCQCQAIRRSFPSLVEIAVQNPTGAIDQDPHSAGRDCQNCYV